MAESRASHVFVVSDALGGTAERIFRAAIVQFQNPPVDFSRIPHVRSQEQVDRVLLQAEATTHPVILYTLVEERLRRYLKNRAAAKTIAAIDVLGPLLDQLSAVLAMPPSEIPGLTHRADSHYFQRVEAAEFAVRYDDGKDPKAIGEADLVLVGVSRTSKTPLSLYLANRRMKVANVPVAPELPVPDLLTKQAQKVVGLTMEPGLLLSVRRERVRALGVTMPSSYASESRIAVELAFAQDLFERIGCPVVDVSHQAVEETADKVLTAWRNRTQRPAEGGWIGPLR